MLKPIVLLTLVAAPCTCLAQTPKPSPRDAIVRTVEQIRKADYEGDRAALQRLHAELSPSGDKTLASRIQYWRGFALWRRAINGFNETPTPTDLEADLNAAIADFKDAITQDSTNVEAKIGEASCLGYLMYINHKGAPTSPTSCWPEERAANGKSPCARHWEPRVPSFSAS